MAKYLDETGLETVLTNVKEQLQTEKIVLSESIPVAGGPLAELAKEVFGEDGIPKDMSTQEILFKLFCKELWPTNIVTTDAKIESKVDAPSLDFNHLGMEGEGGENEGKFPSSGEVGTIFACTISNGLSSMGATGHTASGFEYGYSTSNDNTKESSDKSVSGTYSNTGVASNSITMTVTHSGANNVVQNGNETDGIIIDLEHVCVEGTNKIGAKSTSATYKATFATLPSYYGCSNLGKTQASSASEEKGSVTLTSTTVTSSETSKTFTGYYKYFMGCSNNLNQESWNNAFIRNLEKSGVIVKDGTTTIVGAESWETDGTSVFIACPLKYKLASIKDSFGMDYVNDFVVYEEEIFIRPRYDNGEYEVTQQLDYKIYVYEVTSGVSMKFNSITLTLDDAQ